MATRAVNKFLNSLSEIYKNKKNKGNQTGRMRNESVLLGTQGCRQMSVKDWGGGKDLHNSLPDKTAKQFTNTLA